MKLEKMSIAGLNGVVIREAQKMAAHGRRDYGWYMMNALDVNPAHYWHKMEEINTSVRDYDKTAVGAGHGVSKTYTAARLSLAFLMCWPQSIVVTTAPTAHQVKNITWRAIRESHANARVPMPGKVTETKIDLQQETGKEWYALGMSTRADTITAEATKMQGFHSPVAILIVLEEAAAILPEIWRATQYITAPVKRILAIGNPTSCGGEFAAALQDPKWHYINVSVKDTPNFKQRRIIIPGVHGIEFEREIREKYGIDSDEYAVRVDGQISRKRHPGAYYATKFERIRRQGRIGIVRHNPNYCVYTVRDSGFTSAFWFYQVIGTEVMFIRYYEDSGKGVDDYVRVFETFKEEEGYHYGYDFVPCDFDNNAQRVTTGATCLEILQSLGKDPKPLVKERTVQEGITRSTKFLDRCWFDAVNCKVGIERLEGYHEALNKRMSTEENPIFLGVPEKDGNEHGADAFRYASLAIDQCTSERRMTRTDLKAIWQKRLNRGR